MNDLKKTDPSSPDLLQSLQVVLAAILGAWWEVGSRLSKNSKTFVMQQTLAQLVFLGAATGLLIFAAPHWISYSVTFQSTRNYTVGSNFRILFFLGGILGFILYLFRVPKGHYLYLGYTGFIGAIFLAGIFRPDLIHVKFANRQDIQFQWPWMILWGLSLFLAMLFSKEALKEPLLDKKDIANWLFQIKS